MIVEAERKETDVEYSYSPRPAIVPVGNEGESSDSPSESSDSSNSLPSKSGENLAGRRNDIKVGKTSSEYSPRQDF